MCTREASGSSVTCERSEPPGLSQLGVAIRPRECSDGEVVVQHDLPAKRGVHDMLFFLVCCVLVVCASGSGNDPEQAEPYAIKIVEFELRMRSGGRKIIHGYSLKELHRLGDGVSIAIIKILDRPHLTDPQVVGSFLPIIEAAFAYPDLILRETDKHPRISLLLLDYLSHNVPDLEIQKDIQRTREFVTKKTVE
jgi:hypothetical protein